MCARTNRSRRVSNPIGAGCGIALHVTPNCRSISYNPPGLTVALNTR
jgi:hypothetical protein